jgi:hypothetical protein
VEYKENKKVGGPLSFSEEVDGGKTAVDDSILKDFVVHIPQKNLYSSS